MSHTIEIKGTDKEIQQSLRAALLELLRTFPASTAAILQSRWQPFLLDISDLDISVAVMFLPKQVRQPLTGKQWAVANLVGRGLANKEIATSLGISVDAVSNRLRGIYRKWKIPSRANLSVMAALVMSDVVPPPSGGG